MTRSVALVVAAWLGFFCLHVALSVLLAHGARATAGSVVAPIVVFTALWSAFSLAIAAWHGRVRRASDSVLAMAGLHLPLLVAVGVIDSVVSRWLAARVGAAPVVPLAATVVYFADFDVVAYAAVVLVVEALRTRRAARDRQRVAERLEASLGRARLDYLEAQLQPHFLFNSLGAVSELAHDAPAAARRALEQLRDVFERAHQTAGDHVTVREELHAIDPYLDIQRMRFDDWLTIECEVPTATLDCLLPRFVLQPLVENAIRHGLARREAAGHILIAVDIERDELVVRVIDDGVGLGAGAAGAAGGGIGLRNVRERLRILYGAADRLRLTDNDAGGAVAEVRVPLRRVEDPVRARDDRAIAAAVEERAVRVPAFLRHPFAALVVAWVGAGVLWSQQSIWYMALARGAGAGGAGGPDPWRPVLRDAFGSAGIWAVLTPIIWYAVTRLPVSWRRGAAYVVAGAVTAFAHTALLRVVTGMADPLSSSVWLMTYTTDAMLFFLIVAVAHRRVFVEWVRAREAVAARLTEEIDAAEQRGAALRPIRAVLLDALAGIADTVARDPARAERQLASLADYVRAALDVSDDRGAARARRSVRESVESLDRAEDALRRLGAVAPPSRVAGEAICSA